MEAFFICIIKSSGLIAVFYLVYHFLVRKETFFDSNRWFLLSGLLTSLLLPMFFVKKIILVEKPKINMNDLINYPQQTPFLNNNVTVEAFDWTQFGLISYILISLFLVLKTGVNLFSLYRLLKQQQPIKKEQFNIIDLNQNIAPFSFFNYIVFNSNLYSEYELKSILLHEKIHSKEKHSIDVLVAKIFCIVFWFNPFIWMYKKAILQNLEYIADQKAMQQLDDKESYQRALLKVVTNQNCLSITNNFYQSLIKKRIVMLNKNQSQRKNAFKYAIVLPFLVAFILLFQIKIVAQEKERAETSKSISENQTIMRWTKDSPDSELERDMEELKKQGVKISYSKLKRNKNGEITAIKVKFKDNEGHVGISEHKGNDPIDPITFYKIGNKTGFGNPKPNKTLNTNGSLAIYNDEKEEATDLVVINNQTNYVPEPPIAPIAPIAPIINVTIAEFPNLPEAPTAPSGSPLTNKKEWDKFEQKMKDFEIKMKALEPEIEAYADKMANVDELMKPFEEEMKKFELQMQKFEEEMEEYAEKIQARAEADREKVKDQKARNKR